MSDSPHLSEALHALRDVLVRERGAGQRYVALTPESKERLKGLPGRLRESKEGASATPKPAPASPSPRSESTASPAPAPATARARSTTPTLNPPGATKAEKIAWLAREAERCEVCRGLGTLRDTMVFSVGNPDAALMFVGEAPGFEEERQGEPFVGPAGELLTKIVKTMGLRRPEDVYISNIVKFRPQEGDGRLQNTRNRKPSPAEMAASVKYVLTEIEVIRPRVIVALGATAAEGLLELGGSLASMRNRFHDLKGIPVMVTYHPSYLLRSESNAPDGGKSEKRKLWEDMLLVMERLGLPISDRQRGFFA